MKWSSLSPLISHLAPTVAAALGGPLAGSAVGAIESALHIVPAAADPSLDSRQDILARAIQTATPEQLTAIQQADKDFQLQMAKLGFSDKESLLNLTVQDVDSARKREMAIKDYTPAILGYAVTVGFFSLLFVVCFVDLRPGSKDIVELLTGALASAWTQSVLGYYFGSSLGSDQAAQTLSKAVTDRK